MSELVLTQRNRVRRCDVAADGVSLELSDGRMTLPVLPDERQAARASGLATRVLNVEFTVFGPDERRAQFTAVWHRVPHTRAISVGAALALTLAGVPSYVVGVTS